LRQGIDATNSFSVNIIASDSHNGTVETRGQWECGAAEIPI
jgi:hypothetical protein